jgi:hypothetical protein
MQSSTGDVGIRGAGTSALGIAQVVGCVFVGQCRAMSNEVRAAIAAGRQAVASGNVRSKVPWGEVVGCGSASGPQNVDERRGQRGRVIWEQLLTDTRCGMWGFEARAGAIQLCFT